MYGLMKSEGSATKPANACTKPESMQKKLFQPAIQALDSRVSAWEFFGHNLQEVEENCLVSCMQIKKLIAQNK